MGQTKAARKPRTVFNGLLTFVKKSTRETKLLTMSQEANVYRVGVLTISDSGAARQRVDASGPAIAEMLAPALYEVAATAMVPDEPSAIEARLRRWADVDHLQLVLTTGGTGLGPRDITPEATLRVVDRLVPGLAEAMRARTLEKTTMAMLSRQVCGVRGATLIITLPGSPKAVRECLEVVLPVLGHALDLLAGDTAHHPQPRA